MRIVPLGVRGSTAAPGSAFARYGGHTSCVAVIADGESTPRLLLDAGTGLSALPTLLNAAPFHGTILLSHLHWDHVQGLPFCPAVDNEAAQVDLFVPIGDSSLDARELLSVGFSPPHFPIDPTGLLGTWTFNALRPGSVTDGVIARPIAHKGGPAFGFRVERDGTSLAYLPDHAVTDPGQVPSHLDAVFGGVDLLVHDGQYTGADIGIADAYGHATIEAVQLLADRWEVGAVLLTHHAPSRNDADLDRLAAQYRHTPGGRPITFAVQGRAVDVGRPR